MIDLAARRLGGLVLAASDEFFAGAEHLLLPDAPVFDPHAYTPRGKLMDGWESRRRRGGQDDWVLVRLGVPGVVREVVVDTTHFRGNAPAAVTVEASAADPYASVDELLASRWFPLVPRTDVAADSVNVLAVPEPVRVTVVRLVIHPDGGVARLRLHGDALPDLRRAGALPLDLAASANGGAVLDCSDAFFSAPQQLIAVGDSRDMADGWETKRRRGPGHDWAVIRLAAEGTIARVELDTTNFIGNYPESFELDVRCDGEAWRSLVPPTVLAPHARHVYDVAAVPATQARLTIHPDGGVARLRLIGALTDAGWRAWGTAWLNALPAAQCADELRACCASRRWVDGMVARRPWADADRMLADADAVWDETGPSDWREAFAAHPRIGDRQGSAWSRAEQAGVGEAEHDVLADLAAGNRAYEQRFGHVFLICATGKTAQEMLAALRQRLDNDPDTELHVAAEEQRQITRLRLSKLLGAGGQA